jgi:hypothetical protein
VVIESGLPACRLTPAVDRSGGPIGKPGQDEKEGYSIRAEKNNIEKAEITIFGHEAGDGKDQRHHRQKAADDADK